MHIQLNRLILVAAVGIFACSDDNGPTNGDGNGDGDGNGGGEVGTVTVGNVFFRSGHNGTTDPAVDTVPAGTAVTWTWTNTGSTPHSVRSTASPSFASSETLTGSGETYSLSFDEPGTYQYDCAVHGSLMTGRIVVQ